MHPAITASVPLLEPPGWATGAARAVRPARPRLAPVRPRLHRPGRAAALPAALTSRDGVDDFYEVFFNWPQLYLLGGRRRPAGGQAERHWEGVTPQLTELGMLEDEYERGYDWFHQGESLLLLYFLCMAAPGPLGRAGAAVRRAVRRSRARQLRPRPPHHPPSPQRQRPRRGTGCSTATHYPWLPKEARDVRLPAGLAAARRRAGARARPRTRGWASEMARRMGAGDTAVNLAAAGLVLNA